jgi:hypothetical protein
MELADLQRNLVEELSELRRQRAGPVYVIEHTLSVDEVEELRAAVGTTLRARPLTHDGALSPFWRDLFYPLALLAAEVGYKYGSEGNEYWPRLADALDFPFDAADRHALVAGFRGLKAATGVAPPETAWALHFNLIAWPITHAVLPVWLHEPLLEAIIACPHRVVVSTNGDTVPDYLRWMKDYAAATPRLATFFEQPPARAAIEGLLCEGGGGCWLSDNFLRRIKRDIGERRRSRRLYTEARRGQVQIAARRAPVNPRRGAAAARDAPTHTARLSLVLDDVQPSLEVIPFRHVEIDGALDRVRVRLLGEGRLVSLGVLLRVGARLDVPALTLGDEPRPLLREADLKSVDRQTALGLVGLSLDVHAPLLFSEHLAGGGRADQRLDRAFTRRDGWWVLAADTEDELPDGVDDRGVVCGLHCYRVDGSVSEACEWLEEQGLAAVKQPRVKVVSSPSFDAWREVAGTLGARDMLALLVEGGPIEAAGLGPLADGLNFIEFDGALGKQEIQLSQEGAGDAIVDLTIAADPPPRRLAARVDLEGPSFSVRSLAQRSLSLRVTGRMPFAGLRATLRLRRGEDTLGRAFSRSLPALPALLLPNDPVWDELTANAALDEAEPLVLEVDVEGLAGATWTLESTRPVAPQRAATCTRTFLASAPHAVFEGGDGDPACAALEQPFDDAGPLLGEGLCRRSPGVDLLITVSRPKRLLRRLLDDGAAVGVTTLASAYLAWASAQSADKIAEAHRHAATNELDLSVTEVLCGSRWSKMERGRLDVGEGYGAFLARSLYESGVARDSLLEEELGEGHRALQAPLLRHLASALEGAEVWIDRIADRSCAVDTACDTLAELVNAAYQSALTSVQRPGFELSADVACEGDETSRVLREATAAWEAQTTRREILSLALPQAAHDALEAMDFGVLDDLWLAADLARTLRDAQLKWSEAEVAALLGFWARPRGLVTLIDLRRALNERAGSRMIRYAALRRRDAIGLRL